MKERDVIGQWPLLIPGDLGLQEFLGQNSCWTVMRKDDRLLLPECIRGKNDGCPPCPPPGPAPLPPLSRCQEMDDFHAGFPSVRVRGVSWKAMQTQRHLHSQAISHPQNLALFPPLVPPAQAKRPRNFSEHVTWVPPTLLPGDSPSFSSPWDCHHTASGCVFKVQADGVTSCYI